MRDAKLEDRLAAIDKGIADAFDDALAAADEGDSSLTFARSMEGVALELRALRLAVLSRQPFRWWW